MGEEAGNQGSNQQREREREVYILVWSTGYCKDVHLCVQHNTHKERERGGERL